MNTLRFAAYNTVAVPALQAFMGVAGFFHAKVRTAAQGRKGQWRRIEEVMGQIPASRPRVLFHCTSVGEWEQAVPIIEALKIYNPDLFIAVSFFSPSGFNFVKKHPGVDLKFYLCLDTWHNACRLFRVIAPKLWIISKFDVWPNHVWAARKQGIPIALTAGTLSPNSGRYKGLAGWFGAGVYRHFDLVFPISSDDKDRFMRIFPYPDRMNIAGDTRFDQVFNKGERARTADDVVIFKESSSADRILIGGSIWPADEKHLLPALINLYNKHPHLRLVLVPHELHESHIRDIESVLESAGIPSERYSIFKDHGGTARRVAIIDTIGMLARLYKQTHLAYVGGSFSTGVHNVMEPAVFGQPVVFGPVHMNSFEALELIKAGCAFGATDTFSIEAALARFLVDDSLREQTGTRAMALIRDNIGATGKILTILTGRYDFLSKKNTD